MCRNWSEFREPKKMSKALESESCEDREVGSLMLEGVLFSEWRLFIFTKV